MFFNRADEPEFSLTVRAGEGLLFWDLRGGFAYFTKVGSDEHARVFCSSAQKAVMPNASEALGQDMEEPAADKLVGC